MINWLIFSSPGCEAGAFCAGACADSMRAKAATEILAIAFTGYSPKIYALA
jgi:hypothetical protein